MYKRCLQIALIIAMASATASAEPACLKASDTEALTQYKGIYLSSNLLKEILKARNVFEGQTNWDQGNFDQAILINMEQSQDPISGTNWHESEPLGVEDAEECVTPKDKNELKLRKPDMEDEIYQKIPMPADAYLFQQLLEGCYTDQSNQEICFKNGKIQMDKKSLSATLQLDSSELAAEGNYLKVENDPLFWVLIPASNGWKIYKSDWASAENYIPPDLAKPWKTLTRKSQ